MTHRYCEEEFKRLDKALSRLRNEKVDKLALPRGGEIHDRETTKRAKKVGL